MTEAAAAVADEVGFENFSIGLTAERLGVKTPSLYKHVASQADLAHRIAVLAMHQLADAIRDATQGRAGSDALLAGAQAMRTYVRAHPGRYAAGNAAHIIGPDDPLIPAANRVMDSWAAMLRGYHLDPDQEIHALRMLRSILHGFATIESAGSFQVSTDVDDSFIWMISFIDRGLGAPLPDSLSAERMRQAPAPDRVVGGAGCPGEDLDRSPAVTRRPPSSRAL